MLARLVCLGATNINLLNRYKQSKFPVQRRNVQVSVIGAASEVGSNVALLLKQNDKIKCLQLYDDSDKVTGVGMELAAIPYGPTVSVYAGQYHLGLALRNSDIILMTARTSRALENTTEELIESNAKSVQSLCRAMVINNPNAFLAICTNPINSIVPFASSLLYKYNCYSPKRVFGITNLDTARCKTIAGAALQLNPCQICIPVIGGHSDDTIIPLFSNLRPSHSTLDPCYVDTLTRLLRKAETDVIFQKHGTESATLAVAWSIHEFIDGLVDAVYGNEVILNCFTVNPHFGTRFFSGPTRVGPSGILQTCSDFSFSEYESCLLSAAVPLLNRDVSKGEDYVRYVESFGK